MCNRTGNAAEVATHESTVGVFGARYAVVTNRSRARDGFVASDEAITGSAWSVLPLEPESHDAAGAIELALDRPLAHLVGRVEQVLQVHPQQHA